jgi:hypothetical protein
MEYNVASLTTYFTSSTQTIHNVDIMLMYLMEVLRLTGSAVNFLLHMDMH